MNEKQQKKRIVVWTKTDKEGNEWAFASIDFRTPPDDGPSALDGIDALLSSGSPITREGLRSVLNPVYRQHVQFHTMASADDCPFCIGAIT